MEATARQKGIGIAERPVELIYALDERPPWVQLLVLGLQHVAVICPYLVMVVLVVEAAKLPHDAAQSALGLAMIAVAVMTILQSPLQSDEHAATSRHRFSYGDPRVCHTEPVRRRTRRKDGTRTPRFVMRARDGRPRVRTTFAIESIGPQGSNEPTKLEVE